MSRTGKIPVELPNGVSAMVKDNVVEIKGPKGSLKKSFDHAVAIALENNSLTVTPANNSRLAKAMHGTARSIIKSMVHGVVNGYTKDLQINGVGFKANLQGNTLKLNLGKSHDILYSIPKGITITVTDQTKLKVEGIDKHLVGQVTADIFQYYPVEPYKSKGVTIVGMYVRRKEGKKTA